MAEIHMQASPELAKVRDLVDAVDKKKPDPKDVAELQRRLDALPSLCLAMGGLDRVVQKAIIQETLSEIRQPPSLVLSGIEF